MVNLKFQPLAAAVICVLTAISKTAAIAATAHINRNRPPIFAVHQKLTAKNTTKPENLQLFHVKAPDNVL